MREVLMMQHTVEIETGDGTCPAALSIPEDEGPWPAVIMFPDAGGMRHTMRQMGERLSSAIASRSTLGSGSSTKLAICPFLPRRLRPCSKLSARDI
jgi:hypothetical protein